MPNVSIDDAKHWRECAEEARSLAEEMNDLDARQTMRGIAEQYESLARRAERKQPGGL